MRTVVAAGVALLVLLLTPADRDHPPSTPSITSPSVPVTSGSVVGTRFVSVGGSDANPGTRSAPWRSLAKAVSAAVPGDTIVISAGTYGARGTRLLVSTSGTASAPITFVGDPAGPMPTVLGFVRVSASHVRLRGLLFDGPTGAVLTPTSSNPLGEEVQIAVYGDHVEISGSEIRNNKWHAGIYLDGADDVRILGNHIHDNGNFNRPEQANLDHGIYFARGSGLVANNVIEHNLAHGVQLYPYASNVVVQQNTIVRNGKAGVIIGKAAANNLIVNNIVAHNTDNSIRSHSLTGTGNVARDNVIWANGNGNLGTQTTGITLLANLVADPRFTSTTNYRLTTTSPARDRANPNHSTPTDRDNIPRPQGPAPDIGAYEQH
jgi:hypothetical protein